MTADRPSIVYSDDGPESPYPYRMEGTIERGFGRGSSELGIPTANLPVDASVTPWIADIKSGVYFGYASLALPAGHKDLPPTTTTETETDGAKSPPAYHIYPMVMSIGYNPYYKNEVRSAEVHVLYEFKENFYHVPMRVLLLGFIREEKDYNGLEALIRDIKFDCDVARNSLRRTAWTPRQGLVAAAATVTDDNNNSWPAAGTLDGSWLVSNATAANNNNNSDVVNSNI